MISNKHKKGRKYFPKKHPYLGKLTIHHLVPQRRIRDFYGSPFGLPKNKLRIWELKHAALHVLFGIKTLNEIIRLLESRQELYGYKTKTWQIVFKKRNRREAAKFLKRVRRIVRKKYSHFELDPALKAKLQKIEKRGHRSAVIIYLEQRFKNNTRKIVA